MRLGNPQWDRNLKGPGNKGSTSAQRKAALGRAALLRYKLDCIRKAGRPTLTQIAEDLARKGITTPRGGKWHPVMVKRVMERLA